MGFKSDFDCLRRLIDERRRHDDRGTLLMGDFNAPAGEEAYQHVVRNGEFIDQWYESDPRRFFEPSHLAGADGWEHRQDPKRIDYIFKRACSSLQINEMRLMFNECFYPTVSDHFGCFARFHLC